MIVYLVKTSCEEYANLLHPVEGGEGPAAQVWTTDSLIELNAFIYRQIAAAILVLLQFFRPLCLLLWSPMGGTFLQTLLGQPFTSCLHYQQEKLIFSLISSSVLK